MFDILLGTLLNYIFWVFL